MSTVAPRVSDAPTLLPAPDQADAAPKTAPKGRRRLLVGAIALGATAALAAGGVFAVRFATRPPEIAVVGARVGDVARVLAVTGRVEAERTVLVAPQAGGRVTELVHHEGDVVGAGDVLARLEDTSARSAVRQQQAMLSSKESELAQARRELARTEALVASGAVATAELETARLSTTRAAEEVARLAAIAREGRAQLVLVAPFAGRVTRRLAELGQIVGPETPLFEVATVGQLRVTSEIDERYLRALRIGMHAEVAAVGSDEAPKGAIVSYLAPAIDPQTGAATVRFTFDTPALGLALGTSVDVNVAVDKRPRLVTIPRESVGGSGTRSFVLVVTGGRAVSREVAIEDWPAEEVVVLRGLGEGDLVAVDPKSTASGTRVRAKASP